MGERGNHDFGEQEIPGERGRDFDTAQLKTAQSKKRTAKKSLAKKKSVRKR